MSGEPVPTHLQEIWEAIHQLERQQAMSQTEIDALTTAVGQVAADLEADTATIQAELDAAATANPTVDLSKLTVAVAALDPKAKALGALTTQTAADAAVTAAEALIPTAPETVYAYTQAEAATQVETMVPSGYTTAGFEVLYKDTAPEGTAVPEGYTVYPGPVRAQPTAEASKEAAKPAETSKTEATPPAA